MSPAAAALAALDSEQGVVRVVQPVVAVPVGETYQLAARAGNATAHAASAINDELVVKACFIAFVPD